MTALGAAEAAARPAELRVDLAAAEARRSMAVTRDVRWGWACAALALASGLLWLIHIQASYTRWGLFRWIGVDWGVYYAQAQVLLRGPATAIYDLAALRQAHQALVTYTNDPSIPMLGGHAAYLPLFAWLFVPFAVVPPPVGLLAWLALQAAAAGLLAWRAASLLPRPYRWGAVALVLTSYPVAQGLVLGQVMLLLACAFTECYLALRAGRDFRAGLWLSLLVLKPQYGLLLGLLLLWKRRWTAAGGALLGIAAIVLASLVVAGWPALEALPRALAQEGDFHGRLSPASQPISMLNWRSLLVYAAPGLGSRRGIALTLGLGALTALWLVPVWWGAWRPRDRRFSLQMAALALATVLTSYHSHVYGAALLAGPMIGALAERGRRATRVAIAVALAVSTALLAVGFVPAAVLPPGTVPVGPLFALMVLGCYACVLADFWWERTRVRDGSAAAGGG